MTDEELCDYLRPHVIRGIALLDAKDPGWPPEINQQRLDMRSCVRCVLGQRYGTYSNGLRTLAILPDDWNPRSKGAGSPGGSFYGFAFPPELWSELSWSRVYATLDRLWREEIVRRLTAEVPAAGLVAPPHTESYPVNR